MEIKHTKMNRDRILSTQELVEHVKAIGQAIIDDAEKLAFDADDLSSIGINAVIAPWESCTTVTYRLSRIADPRKDSHGRTEEKKTED